EMQDWIKFANTLKLRMALRVSNVSGFSTGTIMSTTVSAADDPSTPTNFLGLGTEADSNPGYSNASGKQNPYYADYGFDPTGNPVFGNVYWRANAFSVNMLLSTNDPRASELYAPTTNGGVIRGNVFGDPGVKSNPFTSAQGPGLLKSPSQNAVLLSGAESLFLQAEAVNRGFLTGNAQGLYEAGITASFEALGVPDADNAAKTYYSQLVPNVNWATSTNKEQAIITQKWIALNGYFNFEGYNEYRRTGYPNLPSSIDPAAISPTLPTRLPYPLEELTTNQANLAKEGTINVFTSKIFWAK
ncbi:MAG: SusD/RagB family nutrient-binding outer membrane lipoprotein, partial [Bacteroidetes bacterium]|nr:SusD/RagB family nutrient-binding outer membrane lipoprotein [Bacteroidota bacterium]